VLQMIDGDLGYQPSWDVFFAIWCPCTQFFLIKNYSMKMYNKTLFLIFTFKVNEKNKYILANVIKWTLLSFVLA